MGGFGLEWQIVTDTELLAAYVYGGEGVAVLGMNYDQRLAGFSLPNDVEPYGLASVTPYPVISLRPRPIEPLPLVPTLPVTTVFILNVGSVLAVLPSQTQLEQASTAITLPGANAQQNGLAVYQKAIPANEIYHGPPLPIYIYVLNSAQNGETVLRYQMNSDPPYQPAGLTGNPTDPTFIAANSMVSGTLVLTTYALVQGLACSEDGTLAVSDGSVIWLFNAENGDLTGPGGIYLESWNLVACTLAFGPDGNLYVLAGPPLDSPDANGPDSITILKFLPSTGAFLGATQGSPILITTAQLPGNSGVAMTVGGTAAAPIVYVGATDMYGNAVVLTFDGISGNSTANTLQPIGPEIITSSLLLVNTYSLKESFRLPVPFES